MLMLWGYIVNSLIWQVSSLENQLATMRRDAEASRSESIQRSQAEAAERAQLATENQSLLTALTALEHRAVKAESEAESVRILNSRLVELEKNLDEGGTSLLHEPPSMGKYNRLETEALELRAQVARLEVLSYPYTVIMSIYSNYVHI